MADEMAGFLPARIIPPKPPMRARHLLMTVAGSLAAAVALAQPTALVCPTAPAGRPCDTYHFHVQMYRLDNRTFTEVSGVNQFASQSACDRARELHISTNMKAVEYLRNIKKQIEPDRVGPCHCDMTVDRTAPNFLTDVQRSTQLRTAEELRLRLRERLLDEKLTSDSEIVRGLWADPPMTPQLSAPRLVAIPAGGAPSAILTATEDLRPTKTIDTTPPVVAALDLPLVDVGAPSPPPPVAVGSNGTEGVVDPAATAPLATPTEGTAVADLPIQPPPPPAEEVVVAPPPAIEEQTAEVETTTEPEEDILSAQETAERFVSYETQRIQNVIRAATAIADENVKSKIFEATDQRIQLLENLRLMIEGAGMRSRLATAAREVQGEPDRLALIARLFGDDITPHWAPQDAADVIFEVDPTIAAEPERALRDTTGAVTPAQKKRALYLMLAQSATTESQRLWLVSVVEEFLK